MKQNNFIAVLVWQTEAAIQILQIRDHATKSQNYLLKCCSKCENLVSKAHLSIAAFHLWKVSHFNTDDWFLLLWSTQAEQCLLVVSLGVFLQKKSRLKGLRHRTNLTTKPVKSQGQDVWFIYQNSLLQRLSKAGLVLGTDLLQVHLAAWHNNPGHQLLFGSFILRSQV